MIQVTPHMRVLVAVEPADFRRGIDGLARLCREVLHRDPFSGWVFVFRNRRARAVKILVYDGQGFWLCQKRLGSKHAKGMHLGGRNRRGKGMHREKLVDDLVALCGRGATSWRCLRCTTIWTFGQPTRKVNRYARLRGG